MATTIHRHSLIRIGSRLIPKNSICYVEQYNGGDESGINIHIIGGKIIGLEGWTLEDFQGIYDGAPF